LSNAADAASVNPVPLVRGRVRIRIAFPWPDDNAIDNAI